MLKKLLILSYATLLVCGLAITGVAQTITAVTVNNTSFCTGASIQVAFISSLTTFTVQISNASGVFPASLSANIIGTGTSSPVSATLPNITGNGFKVRVISGMVTSAASTQTLQIGNPPSNPTVPSTTVNYCVGATASPLSATGTDLKWYTVASGGTSSSTPPNPMTGTAGTQFYYVSQTVNGCESLRTQITVNVILTAPPTVAQSTLNYCQGDSPGPLSANGSNLKWYTASSGGTGSTTAPTPITGGAGTQLYYVSQTVNNCESSRTTITVNINQRATLPPETTANVVYCQGQSPSTLSATPTSGNTIKWYASNNSTLLNGAPNINTNVNSTTVTEYYVTQATSFGCEFVPRTKVTVTVKSGPTVNNVPDRTHCNGAQGSPITFSGSVPNTIFNWSVNMGVGLSASSGSGNIAAYTASNAATAPVTATVTVTPVADGCTGNNETFTIKVNPTATVAAITDKTYCGGLQVAGINFTSPTSGAGFKWTSTADVGFGTSGNGNIGNYTTTSSNTTPLEATVTVTPTIDGCDGTPRNFKITINPKPTVSINTSGNTFCNGADAAAISFSGSVTGTTYSWTGSADVGFGTSGSGNIAVYKAKNTTTNPLFSTFNVTPSTATCTGSATAFNITINPTPVINTIADAAFCGGASAPAINFSSTTPNTNYAWSSTANVGFGTSGNGNIGGYTAIDSSPTIVTGTVSVTPTANTCPGSPKSFTITVNPSPKVNSITSAVFCNKAQAPAISFSSQTSGATFSWSSSANVGFSTAGTGNIPTYAATNGGATPIIANVSVAAKTATCTGPAQLFTVTVNPTPVLNDIGNLTFCGGTNGTAINFGSTTPNTSFAWSSTSNIGFGANGTGNINNYTLTNPVSSTTLATITVTPTANTCPGASKSFTITINPTPKANLPTPNAICANATGPALTFSSDTPNTTFNWSSSTNVGFGTGGTGNINGGFTAINNSQNVVTATINVVPSTSTCTGSGQQFNFIVNPTPGNPSADSPTYCATSPAQQLSTNGENPRWYNQGSGGSALGEAPRPSTNNSTDNSIVTSYFVTQTNSFGCESPRTEVKVTVKPLPPFPNVPKQEYLLCQFDPSVQLDAKLQGTGQNLVWILPNSNETGNAPVITTDAGFVGTFAVLQVRDGCRGGRTEIKVNVRTTPLPMVSSVPVVSCQNSTPQPLQATGERLKWYNTNKTGGTPQDTPNIPPTQTPGTYQFYVTQTGANTCESPRAEITVVIQPLPSATLTGGGAITQGEPSNLTIAFTGQGPWTYTLSNGSTFTTPQNPVTIQVYPLESTIYNVTKITNNCGEGTPAGSASVQVKIATIDVGNPSATTICASQTFTIPYFSSDFFPSSTQFRVQISKTMDDASFQTIPTEGNNSPVRATIPNATLGGTYYLRIVGLASVAGNNFTIKGKLSPVQINIRELPTATISGPTRIYENESAKLAIAFTGETPWNITYRDSLSTKDTTFSTSVTPYEFTVRPGKTNTYSVVSISNSCGNGPATSRFVLIVDPVLGVEPALSSEWIKVYPVPVQARCTIEIDGTTGKTVSMTVTDGLGRIILRQQTTSNKDELDFSSLAPGMYFLNAERDGQIARRKILKVQ
ncbi:T9SS type A sorting domain-containing protein [Runella aurantiaca]|uniref:T9SS C-terminal target domain-containing protein n=1 Tax=Runella aurantiaca TaxID=2282308 RepID=A0A369I881_9BACT|nr:T9SS type A sorting domain-containing protein [Runella aurantiaca]RDB05262.1 T9SS C-terminal target domain-containing protein [Runella aurantiaca]